MDKQRCRYLLRAYRPNGADADDATLAEALAQAQADPELASWFARETAFDRIIAARVSELRAPRELRQQILGGLALSSRPRHFRRSFATVLVGLAAAVSVAVAIYVALPQRRTVRSFDAIVATAVNAADEENTLSFYSGSIADLRAWLEHEKTPAPGALPTRLAALDAIGCKPLRWEGVPASMVSFHAPSFYRESDGAAADATLHLFTIDQRSCSGGSARAEPVVFRRGDKAVATWRDARQFYVLVVRAPESALRNFLGESGVPVVLLKFPPPPAGAS